MSSDWYADAPKMIPLDGLELVTKASRDDRDAEIARLRDMVWKCGLCGGPSSGGECERCRLEREEKDAAIISLNAALRRAAIELGEAAGHLADADSWEASHEATAASIVARKAAE